MGEEERRFPYPEEVETPPGAEGWEEMYPYYFLPNTEIDKEDFYFLDISHIPEPIPPHGRNMKLDGPWKPNY